MRSHAKASTAGSTQRQATGLGRIFRGVFVNRGASPRAKGSGAPKARRLVLPLALLVALFSVLLGVGSAVAVAPTISSTTVSAVTTKSALLEASINPGGEATTYRFQYGLAACSSNPCTSVPVPNGNVGTASKVVEVTDEIAGLNPGTTYHFRVLATNGGGTVEGPDRKFTTFSPQAVGNCPNEALRVGPAANLANCRAYEMVSPVGKNGGDAYTSIFTSRFERTAYNQSSVEGGKLTYSATTSFGDQVSGRGSNQYIATRGESGWSTHGINAPLAQTIGEPFLSFSGDVYSQFTLFTPDLSVAWVTDNNKKPLTPDGSENWQNLYRRDNWTGSYEALTKGEPTIGDKNFPDSYFPDVQGHSADFSHIVFAVEGALTPDAAATKFNQVYDYVDGDLHLVSVLPDGTASTENSGAGGASGFNDFVSAGVNSNHAVSADGSRVFWTAFEGIGQGPIYVRENPAQPQSALNGGNECTEPVKACTRAIVTGNTNQFWAASADGSKVVYTTDTLGSTATLTKFDVDAEVATPIAGEVGGVVGTSDDASHVYFTSKESLAPGAMAGEWNLYLDHEGVKSFIATLAPEDRDKTKGNVIDSEGSTTHVARVTSDGKHLAFQSLRSLTGYDNTDAVNGKADVEVYLFDAETDELTCVSCNPSGARPMGQELMKQWKTEAAVDAAEFGSETGLWAAAWLQSTVQRHYASRALSDDGNRLYFNAFDALVSEDTNGAQDVYQWERQGTGTCQKASGCVSLISTGASPKRSEFVDSTPDGSEVFFETSSSIDPRDPGLIDIYVARVNGGFPVPPEPPACVGDACQSIPPAPNDPTPASASFKGAGDPVAKKPRRRNCRARGRQAAKNAKGQARHKKAKRCKRAKRGTKR